MEKGCWQQLEQSFDVLENEITRRLRGEEAYMMWVQRRVEIQVQHPFVKSVMDGDACVFPSDQDYQAWLEIQKTLDETVRLERMALYWQGHADCYAYLKKLGAL
ncbi:MULTISPECIES: hypothetical protein [Paenibacillaceae]|jgi:hypothetical protein|uniref:hypothetical protein n=1 Tax=Paenibacillaceae TaxID=186822 RepID=UPI001ADC6A2D|nr:MULTISPECIES: hypothetical protein [Paenibacillaceae]QTH40873.1 hypothetical protein J4772_25400 [Cohnella sp. LGH]